LEKEFIQHHFDNLNFKFYRVDLLTNKIYKYFKNVDEVWHLAVNADVRSALKDIKVDIKQNIIVTYRVLEAMRKSNVKKLSLLHLQQSMAKLKKYQHQKIILANQFLYTDLLNLPAKL
jgi:dTDP-D-glucose 4,6-dehydratase